MDKLDKIRDALDSYSRFMGLGAEYEKDFRDTKAHHTLGRILGILGKKKVDDEKTSL